MNKLPTRRGFAIILAVCMIPIATVSIGAVGRLVNADVGRTCDEISEMQLTQMLLAGCLEEKNSRVVAVPEMLVGEGGRLRVERDGDRTTVEAVLGGHVRSVILGKDRAINGRN